MIERGFNYPTHPLFGIAPLLDRGFQTVQFDPYERVLIAKIRSGQYCADLWNCNGFYLDYGERLASPADRQATAFKSRYEMTAEQRKEYQTEQRAAWEARAPQRAARKAEKEERERFFREAFAERQRERQAHEERQERKRQEQEQRDLEWAERNDELERERAERAAILTAPWQCVKCLKRAEVRLRLGRYELVCAPCSATAVAPHETLVKLMKAAA